MKQVPVTCHLDTLFSLSRIILTVNFYMLMQVDGREYEKISVDLFLTNQLYLYIMLLCI